MKINDKTARLFWILMRTNNPILKDLSNKILELPTQKKIIEVIEFVADNPKKAVTDKIKDRIYKFKSSDEDFKTFYYQDDYVPLYNKNKVPCPKCKEKSTHWEGDLFKCESCEFYFYYDGKLNIFLPFVR